MYKSIDDIIFEENQKLLKCKGIIAKDGYFRHGGFYVTDTQLVKVVSVDDNNMFTIEYNGNQDVINFETIDYFFERID